MEGAGFAGIAVAVTADQYLVPALNNELQPRRDLSDSVRRGVDFAHSVRNQDGRHTMKNDHWWRGVPQFVTAQESSDFMAWVEAIDLGIDLCVDTPADWFPGIPNADWFSDGSIAYVEKLLSDRYEDQNALDHNWSDRCHFVKYFGQAWVEKLECKWVWQPKVEPYWAIDGPALERPWPSNMLFDVIPMVNAAVTRRTGDEWLFVFRNNREDYLDWKAQGSFKSWDGP